MPLLMFPAVNVCKCTPGLPLLLLPQSQTTSRAWVDSTAQLCRENKL